MGEVIGFVQISTIEDDRFSQSGFDVSKVGAAEFVPFGDDDEAIGRRLAASFDEIAQFSQYMHVIINDDVDRAAEALIAVVLSRRHGLVRMQKQIEMIIDDFRSHIVPN